MPYVLYQQAKYIQWSTGPVCLLIFCSISICLLANLLAHRTPSGLQQGMYSIIPLHWNIKSPPASPGRSHVGPALQYMYSITSEVLYLTWGIQNLEGERPGGKAGAGCIHTCTWVHVMKAQVRCLRPTPVPGMSRKSSHLDCTISQNLRNTKYVQIKKSKGLVVFI